MMGPGGRAVLGLALVAVGAMLVGDTIGAIALDMGRVADLWPLVFVVIGLAILVDAWAPGRRSTAGEPSHAVPGAGVDDEVARRVDRILAARSAATGYPGEGAPVAPPSASPPASDHDRGRADVVPALLMLQGLRRNGLISRRQYRARRAELVALLTPSLLLDQGDRNAAAEPPGDDRGSPAAPRPSSAHGQPLER